MLEKLRQANARRSKEWDPNGKLGLSFFGCELAGETGEACNIAKKLERERLGIVGSRSTVERLAEELADIVIVVDMIATMEGIDLPSAIAEKFNKTSKDHGFKTFIK